MGGAKRLRWKASRRLVRLQKKIKTAEIRRKAAVRLQRWYRQTLPVWTWEAYEIAPRLMRRHPGIVRVVEPLGLVYHFDAQSLALAFISTGFMTHPITRRKFLPVEVARTARALQPMCALLLRWTYKYSLPAQQAACNQDSLEIWLHASAGEKLDALLLSAEHGKCPLDLTEDYMDGVGDLALQLPWRCLPLLRAHAELAERRKQRCEPGAWARVSDAIDALRRSYSYTQRCAAPTSVPAFCWWLREALQTPHGDIGDN